MKKILYMVTNVRVSNGVTSVIMNHYKKLLDNGYVVDFCAMYNWGSPYVDEIIACGSNYYVLPQADGVSNAVVSGDATREGTPDKKQSEVFLKKLIVRNQYDIIHVHIVGKYALMALKIARECGVAYRIFHSHNPIFINDLHSLLFTLFYDTQCKYYANRYLACSSIAGKSTFRKRTYSIIKNTIDTKEICYTDEGRKRVRRELGIGEDVLLFGTVCRQTYQKNPYFIVDIYASLKKLQPKSRFIWIGSGELEQEVIEYAKSKGLEKEMIFLGNKLQMADFYSAMDVFILPSRYEGLGIVFIEAQSCGLLTYASDVVPKDTQITDLIQYISLKESTDAWAKKISLGINKISARSKYSNLVLAAGFDKNCNNDLVDYYNKYCVE